MWRVALLVALACPAFADAPVDRVRRRESAAEVGAVLRDLRRPAIRPNVRDGDPQRVYVLVPVLSAERRAALEASGLVIEVPAPGRPAPRWRGAEAVQGLATPAAQGVLAALPFVRGIEPPGEAWPNAGAVESAGDRIHLGPVARSVLGTDGAGVAVGVISDGVDGRDASIASGDLPADLELPAIPGLSAGQGDEGTAILEIVHDFAPAAHLLFAPARTSVEMVVAIDGLAAAGAQVIVDDLVFTDEPKFEDGPIAATARRFATGGVYVTAAGNYARAHYFSSYHPTGGATFGGFRYRAVHAFAARDVGNSFRIPAGGEILAVLQWSDRFGGAADDLDLILARPAAGGDVLLAASADAQNGSGNPLEAVRYVNRSGAPLDVYLAIGEYARVTAPASLRLNLILFSELSIPLEHAVRRESVLGHAAVEEVLSVAAADAVAPDTTESFSSNGPATILFPTLAVRRVPRLTAVDDVETAVGRRGFFPNPFRGTSAAAPHVAGCAALLLAAGVPATTATSALEETALDLPPADFDFATGAGLLDCAAAARLATGAATAPVVRTLTAGFDPTAAVVVQAAGDDAEGDVRTAIVRLLGGDADELTRQTLTVAPMGTAFSLAAAFRGAVGARARFAAARAKDATGLQSAEVQVAIGCPGDGSLGDVLCGVGDLLDLLAAVPGGAARRVERAGQAAATVLARAGAASAAGRPRRVRQAVDTARARLAAAIRRARRLPAEPSSAVQAQAQVLRERLRALR